MKTEIDPTELEDFIDLLKEKKLRSEDFELSAVEHRMPAGGIAPIRGEVTVHHKPTGKTHRYKTGHDTAWVVDFEQDLAAGAYS